MADPDGDAGVVQDLTHVVGVDALDDEGDGAGAVVDVDRSDDAHPRTLRQTGEQARRERLLVRGDPGQTQGPR